MPNTLSWALLPRGVDRQSGRAKFSLTATPAVISPSAQVGDSVIADWPARVRELLPRLRLRAGDLKAPLAITVGPTRPDSDMWRAIIPNTAPVGAPPGGVTQRLPAFTSSGAFDRAHAAAATLYEQALETSPTQRPDAQHPVTQALAALARLTATVGGDRSVRATSPVPAGVVGLLEPGDVSASRVDEAVDALWAAGLAAEAQVAPLVPYIVRQRQAARASVQPPDPPGPLPDLDDEIPPLDRADVHQLIGLLADHPAIARQVGLVIDFEADLGALAGGTHLFRVVDGDQLPLAGLFDHVKHPWSSVDYQPSRSLVMTTRADADAEIRAGMLDLRPDSHGAGYLVGDLDVRSIARQLAVIATTIPDDGPVTERAPANGPQQEVVLPIRRDPGFIVAQSRRLETVAKASMALPDRLADPSAGRADESFDGDAVLFADDVTGGYRVDVSRNGAPFRSLMRRVARYRVAGRPRGEVIEVHDEGVVEGLTAVAERLGNGTSTVTLDEEVFGWDGFSLGAELPGPKVAGDRPGTNVTNVDKDSLPGYGLSTRISVEPGSLPALRYGDTYSFAARAVDLAGNSLPPEDTDPAMASAPAMFRRHDVVAAPNLVLRRPLVAGETLQRLIVKTDGDGQLLEAPSERHLAPPSAPVRLVERHGMLDAAFGPDSEERRRARRAMLDLASREAGSFTDPMVSDGRGGHVPAVGIGVVSTTGADPVTLPLPPGEPLPPGQYVFHDTDALRVPYLPDPGASGVVLLVPFTGPEGIFATYGGKPWPQATPIRIVTAPATKASGEFRTRSTPTGDVIECPLSPGDDITMALASTIPEGVVDVMDPLSPGVRGLAIDGFIVAFSPRQTIRFLHATRKPVAAPTMTAKPVKARIKGQTGMQFLAALTAHGPTTGKVDIQAEWTEIVDDAVTPVQFAPRKAVLDSRAVKRTDSALPEQLVSHDFADTKRRDFTLTPVAATRFRDCFPDLPVGDPRTIRAGAATKASVQNSSVPAPPEIHSVVPIYRWTREHANGGTTSTREMAGVRLYLRRPWFTTGVGESLGVITYSSQATAGLGEADRLTGLISRWGKDTVEGDAFAAQRLGATSFPLAHTTVTGFVPQEMPNLAGDPTRVLVASLHEVKLAEDRQLWYADVDVNLDYRLPFFLRLAVVRYQSTSASGCFTSRIVVTDWVPLSTDKRVQVRVVGPDEVEIDVDTRLGEVGRRYEAALEPRLTDGTPDITTPVGAPVALIGTSPAPGVFVARGRVRLTASNPADRARLAAGRLVVREIQTGEQIDEVGGAERTVFLETFAWSDLFT
ncbi:MAG TPA: hypothetical protein VFU35_07290 [Jatrophihabitans sp.]|nr:hypothetical protein [Jatrophihabitans sp.]